MQIKDSVLKNVQEHKGIKHTELKTIFTSISGKVCFLGPQPTQNVTAEQYVLMFSPSTAARPILTVQLWLQLL